ncbi:MAG: baseplate assembly protein [Pseudomonadota bacterium]
MTDYFGQDIKLDDNMQAAVAANGELILTDGTDTAVQDIRIRLFTILGGLFYDVEFGSKIHEWINEENTPANRMGFESEVIRCVQKDPAVISETVSCRIIRWDDTGIQAELLGVLIGEDHPFNLVIEVGNSKMELVIKDVTAG